jgi:hypothetical protein
VKLALRPLVAADAAWLDAWLPDVAALVGYTATTVADVLAGVAERRPTIAQVILDDGQAQGLVVYRTGVPQEDAAVIELVALPRSASRRGLGMGAATLVEDSLRAEGVAAVSAPACARNGISVYFWIRLGYQPIMRAEWPCEIAGVAWMRRKI